jgi:hypothetical protein
LASSLRIGSFATAAVFVVVLGALPSVAGAATVTTVLHRGNEESDGEPFRGTTFTARSGERNRLTLRYDKDFRPVFHDAGALVTAHGKCKQLDTHSVRCPSSSVQVRLGDRDDRAKCVADLDAFIDGGAGDDVLIGGQDSDFLMGGDGKDVLRGRGEADDLHAGSGRDRVLGGAGEDILYDDRAQLPTSADVFDGGDGDDWLDYSARTSGLDLDLARDPVSAGPEGDAIEGIENLVGGSGPDRLKGDGGDNVLLGNAGDDVLSGRGLADHLDGGDGADELLGGGGDDELYAGAGADHIHAGAGDDDIFTAEDKGENSPSRYRDLAADEVDCGDDADRIWSGPLDTLSGCETFAPGPDLYLYTRVVPRSVSGNSATFTIACREDPHASVENDCAGKLHLSGTDGTDYGGGGFDVHEAKGPPKDFTVTLTEAGSSALAAGAMVVVELTPGPKYGYRVFMKATG